MQISNQIITYQPSIKRRFFCLSCLLFFETADLRSYCGSFLAICQLCFCSFSLPIPIYVKRVNVGYFRAICRLCFGLQLQISFTCSSEHGEKTVALLVQSKIIEKMNYFISRKNDGTEDKIYPRPGV